MNLIMSQITSISWSVDSLLTWSDFKAESNPASFEDAHSVIKYRYTWTINSENVGKQIMFFIENINLTTEFYPLLSWVRLSQATSNLLKHEQGHFDLAESLRPDIEKHIQNVFAGKKFPTRGQNQEQQKQFAREDSGLMIAKEVEKWEKILSEKQEEYDNLTNFGYNLKIQLDYDNMFNKLRNIE
jgi:hypothetical protein